MKCRILLILVVLAALSDPVSAGIFKKTTKPNTNPKDRVSELIFIVKADKDEAKRAGAAEELREYDSKEFPDIVPILIDVLLNDAKPAVRSTAAQSLAKIRPISTEVGWALEQAVAKDSSMRVRLQARSSLLQYHWAGYRPAKEGPVLDTKEPPLAPSGIGPALNPPQSTPSAVRPAIPRLFPTPAPVAPASTRPLPSEKALTPTTEPPLFRPLPSGGQGPNLDPPAL